MAYDYIRSFLSGSSKAGLITLKHTSFSRDVVGILASEVNVVAQTRYGSLIPDISMLTDIASIAGFSSLPTWIGASAQAWKGTEPIQFGAEMYLVNYKPDLGYEEDLKALTKLCTLGEGTDAFGGYFKGFTTKVHGGYSIDPFANNTAYHDGNMFSSVNTVWQNLTSAKDKDGKEKDQNDTSSSSSVKDLGDLFKDVSGTDITGTLTVQVGTRFKLSNILLTKIDVTPSLAEVSSSASGPGKPLFYKVGMSFLTCRAALTEDVDKMF